VKTPDKARILRREKGVEMDFSNKGTIDMPTKSRMQLADLFPALVPGIIFTVMSSVDISFDLHFYSHPHRLAGNYDLLMEYLQWRAHAPYLSTFLYYMGMTLLFLGLYGTTKEGLIGLFTKRATAFRHAIDFFDFVLTLAFAYLVHISLRHFMGEIYAKTVPLDDEIFDQLYTYHFLLFWMNIIGLVVPIVRYREGLSRSKLD